MPRTALSQLRENIRSALDARKAKQRDLAFVLGLDETSISKFLKGQRGIQLEHLDKIADFFGVETYQLFAPGGSVLTERRSGLDRRSGRERRTDPRARMAARLSDRSVVRQIPLTDESSKGIKTAHTFVAATSAEVPHHGRDVPPAAVELASLIQQLAAINQRITELGATLHSPAAADPEARPPQPARPRRRRASR